MDRRFFLACSMAAFIGPIAAEAQLTRRPVTIGVLAIEAWSPLDTFRQALRELGYMEGQNVTLEYRYAEGRNERFPELAAELVSIKVDVIITWGTAAALAAKRATTTIPVVMAAIADPITPGVVTNLARPGANITGLSALAGELEAKRLDLLKELLPGLSRVGLLTNPTNVGYTPHAIQRVRVAAQRLNVTLSVHEARDATTLDAALERLMVERPDALMVLVDVFLLFQRRRLAQYGLKNRLPSMYAYREHVEAGGLIAYSTNYHDLFRRAAGYVDKILKGAKPGDLPVEQASTFELFVNVKTAKTLGLTIPPSILARGAQLIE